MTRFLRPVLALAFLSAVVFAAGCDSASSTDFEGLVTDARLARQTGDLPRAIRLYEDALRSDPASAVVRTELAATHLQRANVDILVLRDFVDYLTGAAGGTAAPAPEGSAAGATCSVPQGATVFDPRDLVSFDEILAQRPVIQLAMEILLGGGPAPGPAVIPAQLTGFTVCTGIVNGQIILDREGARAAMRAQGLTDQQIASALAVHSISQFLDAYFFLTTELPAQTTWYRLADGAIQICAADPDALRTQAEEAIQNVGRALAGLDLRAFVLGAGPTDPVRQIVDQALDAYGLIEADLRPYCN